MSAKKADPSKNYEHHTKEERAEICRENARKGAEFNKTSAYPKVIPPVGRPRKSNEYDMFADIYDARAKYPPEDKIKAATCFALTGTLKGAARLSGLKAKTIGDWKRGALWWDNVLAKVKKEKQDELDALFTDVIHQSVGKLKERIESGEEVIVKSGDQHIIMKKGMSGRDLANAINSLYQNRAMLRGDPTSITAKTTPADTMRTIKEEFEQIAKEAAKKELDKKVVN